MNIKGNKIIFFVLLIQLFLVCLHGQAKIPDQPIRAGEGIGKPQPPPEPIILDKGITDPNEPIPSGKGIGKPQPPPEPITYNEGVK